MPLAPPWAMRKTRWRYQRPCRFCRKWFRADPRVGKRQRACSDPECQRRRRAETQATWRARHPDYQLERKLLKRSEQARDPETGSRIGLETLRIPARCKAIPWHTLQDQIGVEVADFLILLAQLLLWRRKDQIGSIPLYQERFARRLLDGGRKDQIKPVPKSSHDSRPRPPPAHPPL